MKFPALKKATSKCWFLSDFDEWRPPLTKFSKRLFIIKDSHDQCRISDIRPKFRPIRRNKVLELTFYVRLVCEGVRRIPCNFESVGMSDENRRPCFTGSVVDSHEIVAVIGGDLIEILVICLTHCEELTANSGDAWKKPDAMEDGWVCCIFIFWGRVRRMLKRLKLARWRPQINGPPSLLLVLIIMFCFSRLKVVRESERSKLEVRGVPLSKIMG